MQKKYIHNYALQHDLSQSVFARSEKKKMSLHWCFFFVLFQHAWAWELGVHCLTPLDIKAQVTDRHFDLNNATYTQAFKLLKLNHLCLPTYIYGWMDRWWCHGFMSMLQACVPKTLISAGLKNLHFRYKISI